MHPQTVVSFFKTLCGAMCLPSFQALHLKLCLCILVFMAIFFAAETSCHLDLLVMSAQPESLAPNYFHHLKLYLKARVKEFFGQHPDRYIGILHYANGPLIACPMSGSKYELYACIDNTMATHTNDYIGTMSAMALAGRYLNGWYFGTPMQRGRQNPQWAVEGVRHMSAHPCIACAETFYSQCLWSLQAATSSLVCRTTCPTNLFVNSMPVGTKGSNVIPLTTYSVDVHVGVAFLRVYIHPWLFSTLCHAAQIHQPIATLTGLVHCDTTEGRRQW